MKYYAFSLNLPIDGRFESNLIPNDQSHTILVNGRGHVAGQPSHCADYGFGEHGRT